MGLSVDTTLLYRKAGRQRVLCDGLYLRATPGTLTAILGPSGCGKSVFLRLLAGYDRPDDGSVQLGELDVHRDYHRVRREIGYVPQAEIMLPELTVRQSLDYRARFRFPRMGRRERDQRIRETLELLGFGSRVDDLLGKRIGSPESRGGYPSGGERRKINIAHELLSDPLVLFMDEPTSGLAATDADDLVEKFKSIAGERDLAIVLTVHAPSQQAFNLFDDILVMGRNGIVAYNGKRRMAVPYVRQVLGVGPVDRQNDADFILEPVRDDAEAVRAKFKLLECRGRAGFEYLKVPLDHHGDACLAQVGS